MAFTSSYHADAQDLIQLNSGIRTELNKLLPLDSNSILISGAMLKDLDTGCNLIYLVDKDLNILKTWDSSSNELACVSSLGLNQKQIFGIQFDYECAKKQQNYFVQVDTSSATLFNYKPLDYYFIPIKKPLKGIKLLSPSTYMAYRDSFIFFFSDSSGNTLGGKIFNNNIVSALAVEKDIALVAVGNQIIRLSKNGTELKSQTYQDKLVDLKPVGWGQNIFVAASSENASIVDENGKTFFDFNGQIILNQIDQILGVYCTANHIYIIGNQNSNLVKLLQFNRSYNLVNTFLLSNQAIALNDWFVEGEKFFGIIKRTSSYCNFSNGNLQRNDCLIKMDLTDNQVKTFRDLALDAVLIDTIIYRPDPFLQKIYTAEVQTTISIINRTDSIIAGFDVHLSGTFFNLQSICLPQFTSLSFSDTIYHNQMLEIKLPSIINDDIDTLLEEMNLKVTVIPHGTQADDHFGNNFRCLDVKINIVGIEQLENQLSDVKVYPNLAEIGVPINISTNNNQSINYKLFNSLGKELFSEEKTSEKQIKTHNLGPGIYFIHLEKEGQKAIRKLILY